MSKSIIDEKLLQELFFSSKTLIYDEESHGFEYNSMQFENEFLLFVAQIIQNQLNLDTSDKTIVQSFSILDKK